MQIMRWIFRRRTCSTAATLCAALTVGASSASPSVEISQRERRFTPDAVTLAPNEILRILNDDRFIHHVFFNTESRSYDSGDQRPGQSVDLRFPAAGVYQVQCAIHPKMRLTVTVGDE